MRDRPSTRVALVQAAPAFLDPAGSVTKAIDLVAEAAAQGALLVAFGEGFLPAPPIWLHVHAATSPAQIDLASRLIDAAITIPGPETGRLSEAARATGTTIVLGAVERIDPRSSQLALSALVINPDGNVTSRRKLTPAAGERVLFTAGEADSIRLFDTPVGPISVLLGGENSNPLLTWTLRELGARLHVALWPPHFNKPGVLPDVATITGRAIAYQNSAHVLSVVGATSVEQRATISSRREDRALLEAMALDPGSTVYAPRGTLLAGPYPGGEGVLYADLDQSSGRWASLVNRQYDRPDLLRVIVNGSAGHAPLTIEDRPTELERPLGRRRSLGLPPASSRADRRREHRAPERSGGPRQATDPSTS